MVQNRVQARRVTLPEMLEDWIASGVRNLRPVGTVSDLVRHFGGTKETAKALGVSQRAIQRYTKAERGEAGQVRRPGGRGRTPAEQRILAALQQVYAAATRQAIAESIRKGGVDLAYTRVIVKISHDIRTREVRDIEINPRTADRHALDAFANAIAAGDYDEAADWFEPLFKDAWGVGDDTQIRSFHDNWEDAPAWLEADWGIRA